MNRLRNLNIKKGLLIVIISSILICFGISWIYMKQKMAIKHEITVLENIRQARIDLAKGFLHIGLAGDARSPFKQEIGIAYINQAATVFKKSVSIHNHPGLTTITAKEEQLLQEFSHDIFVFQQSLANDPLIQNAKTKTNLRIQFYNLEKQTDQIDNFFNLNLTRLSTQQNSEFLTALLFAVFLLTLICIIFFNLILKINKANQKLIASQNQLKTISDNLVNGMIYQVATINGDERSFNYVSNAVNELYGSSPDQVLKNASLIYSKIHPDDIEALIEAEKEALINYTTFKKEARVINPDGSIRWSYYVSQPRRIDGIVCWDGIELDITDRKEMEFALLDSKKQIEESEIKYRIATEATKDGIWEWDLETDDTIFSKRFYEILGFEADYDVKPLTFQEWEDRLHPDDKERVLQTIQDHLENKTDYNVEYRHLHKSNKYRWQNSIGKSTYDENGKPIRMIGSIRDITTSKLAEKQLNEERNFLKNILENMSDAFISLSKDWTITDCNAKAGLITGKNPIDLIGKKMWDEFPEAVGYPVQRYYEQVMTTKEPLQSEDYYDPYEIWIRNSIFATKTGIAVFFSDITNRKKTELELVKAKEKAEESDQLKSAFLANMSHEIRTPMNGILGFSSLLSEPGLGKEEQQEYINLIQISGARMLNLISEIIDISKIESGMVEISMQEVNVNEKVQFVYDLLKLDAEEKSIELSYNSNQFPDLYLITDPEKLYAILTNLVKNAIKYTDKGAIEFGYNIKDKNIEFFVKDTGIGIPLARQAAIFERFIQVDIANIQARQGAGLGLAIAKAFVSLLGGKIWLESQEGIGTTFYFTLPFNTQNKPLNLQKAITQQIEKENASHISTKLKMLIADDDAISRKLILKTVDEFGDQIIQAVNGREAVAKFLEHSDVDLILMDVQMPEMNGYEAIREIRKINNDVIIITQSAFGLTGDREKAISAGSTDYITKPLDKNELVQLLNKYFIDLKD